MLRSCWCATVRIPRGRFVQGIRTFAHQQLCTIDSYLIFILSFCMETTMYAPCNIYWKAIDELSVTIDGVRMVLEWSAGKVKLRNAVCGKRRRMFLFCLCVCSYLIDDRKDWKDGSEYKLLWVGVCWIPYSLYNDKAQWHLSGVMEIDGRMA